MPKGRIGKSDFIVSPGVIGFCGRLYPCYKIAEEYRCTGDQISRLLNRYREIISDEDLDSFLDDKENYISRLNISVKKIDNFQENNLGIKISNQIFADIEAPIFVYISGHSMIANPESLKEIGFPNYMNGRQAYQELSMFIGGVLNTKEWACPTTGDDQVILLSKGFDKNSFKQVAPGEKKMKRKLNKERKRNGTD
ncbi:hypothetical protein H6G33_10335 [Calothrix sp. FACHB-1219]|uniref:hypothetical protein n=1 Tax=unclassified Calothrix TaxID=2619626 RepID=UPI0016832259|nr:MULTISPECIES: hypothetical protein [unclassified Calothrix]MBD2201744.1 hypothetical protein [Calothrix sp. FACHB-168]MBD2217430.1 hypothetical protein [Calothrix sp. FACHB-1219]